MVSRRQRSHWSIWVFLIIVLTACGGAAVETAAVPAAMPTDAPTSVPAPTLTPAPATTTPEPPVAPPAIPAEQIPFTETGQVPPLAAEQGSVIDVEGNTYRTLRISEQWWMAENLKVTSDPQGNPVTGYCYDNDKGNCQTYGRLYTWDTAMNGSTAEGTQGICPDGWHVPSDVEWNLLFELLGGIDVAGGKMKEAGTTHWQAPNTGATNESGFSGLPAGGYYSGAFEGLGIGGHYWSSTENGPNAGLPTLHCEYANVIWLNESKSVTASVRCVKDH